jgi:hypothetical protein
MGWLTDIGNVAVGAIDRDREITKEDLIIRAENLQANQKLLVEQKKKKYDKELTDYYKEKEKFDEIEKMNALKASGGTTDRAYAAFALRNTNIGWDSLPDKEKMIQINAYDGKTINYELTGSTAEINKKAADAITLINNETSAAIKDAKGNSFLINKILRKKEKVEKDIYAAIEGQLKAADAVKMTTESVNPENVGLDVKVGGGTVGLASMSAENALRYENRFDKVHDKAFYENPQNAKDILAWIKSVKLLGQDTEAAFKFNADDTEITGVGDAGSALAETYKNLYQTLWENMNANQFAANGITRNELGGIINHNTINKEVQSILLERYENIPTGTNWSTETNRLFTAVIPLNILNKNNKMMIGSGENRKAVTLDIDKAKEWYKEFLTIAGSEIEDKFKKDKNIKSLMEVQTLLESGRGYVGAFEGFIEDKLKAEKVEQTDKEEKKTTVNVVVEDGLTGISHPDLGFTSFVQLEKNGTIEATLLKYPHLKEEYDKWKSTQ